VKGDTLSGAEALLRALRGMGVERIFASPGSDWAPVWEALARNYGPGEVPEYISVRHEETAVAMASGYSKATGKLPAVILHTTVGALHASMAVRIARHERVPMVVLAGEVISFGEPPAPMVGRQWLRLLTDTGGPARLMEPCVKWSYALNSSNLLPQTMQRACQLAMTAPRGPVFVSVPTEYLLEKMTGTPAGPAALPTPAAADPAALDALARELCAAKNPLIITEEAGRDVAAVRALVDLAETLGAQVIEAWQPYYANFPRKHPLYGGVVADGIAEVVNEADVVLLADSVLPWHPPSSLPKGGTKVFAIGEDPLRSNLPYWGFRTDMVVPGDLRITLEGLAARCKPARPSGKVFLKELPTVEAKSGIDSRWVAHELNAVLPKGAAVVNETITHRPELLRMLANLGPGDWFESSFGGLGVGTGAALGVKNAQPGRTVIATIGDGAFHYNPVVAAFGAAQEHKLPFLVILFNNSGYLSQKTDVVNYHPNGEAVRTNSFVGTSITPAPDYTKLAEAYGGWGERVEKPGEVRAAIQRGLAQVAQGKLALLDMVLAPVNG
jgi:acetolactate synthase-1/2/3 large subunit